jgi:amino acid permease
VFHTITAVVGAGVLGLPYAIAALGLPGGVLALLLACVVSLWCSYLLAALHQIDGRRYNSYRSLGEAVLGPVWGFWAVAPFQVSEHPKAPHLWNAGFSRWSGA